MRQFNYRVVGEYGQVRIRRRRPWPLHAASVKLAASTSATTPGEVFDSIHLGTDARWPTAFRIDLQAIQIHEITGVSVMSVANAVSVERA
ncbi:hypothetical protein [Variovorax sp.]|jgi:hypothetical protein|uniref:hypothetical protein n=1 Tax=Variovorax sp. TaxID=1871043 RepID=UPI0025DDE6CE|nr:hypothetical protein [Variovorax sp.]